MGTTTWISLLPMKAVNASLCFATMGPARSSSCVIWNSGSRLGHHVPRIRADPEQMRTMRYEPGRKYGLVERRWKYVHRTQGRDELFDLQGDPYETHNLVTERPERAREMKARLLARVKTLREGAVLEPDPADAETAELLEELGYVP